MIFSLTIVPIVIFNTRVFESPFVFLYFKMYTMKVEGKNRKFKMYLTITMRCKIVKY